jgi:hypothetical protein
MAGGRGSVGGRGGGRGRGRGRPRRGPRAVVGGGGWRSLSELIANRAWWCVCGVGLPVLVLASHMHTE